MDILVLLMVMWIRFKNGMVIFLMTHGVEVYLDNNDIGYYKELAKIHGMSLSHHVFGFTIS